MTKNRSSHAGVVSLNTQIAVSQQRIDSIHESLIAASKHSICAFAQLTVDDLGQVKVKLCGVEPAHAYALLEALPHLTQQLKKHAGLKT